MVNNRISALKRGYLSSSDISKGLDHPTMSPWDFVAYGVYPVAFARLGVDSEPKSLHQWNVQATTSQRHCTTCRLLSNVILARKILVLCRNRRVLEVETRKISEKLILEERRKRKRVWTGSVAAAK
jgi:hypothetical protein